AQETIDQDEAERMAEKMRKADFNLEDFLAQLQQMKKLGPMENILGMLPGMSGVKVGDKEEKQFQRMEAIVQSMTIQERRNPNIMNGSRRLRGANGSGTGVSGVNHILKKVNQTKKRMKEMGGRKGKKMHGAC